MTISSMTFWAWRPMIGIKIPMAQKRMNFIMDATVYTGVLILRPTPPDILFIVLLLRSKWDFPTESQPEGWYTRRWLRPACEQRTFHNFSYIFLYRSWLVMWGGSFSSVLPYLHVVHLFFSNSDYWCNFGKSRINDAIWLQFWLLSADILFTVWLLRSKWGSPTESQPEWWYRRRWLRPACEQRTFHIFSYIFLYRSWLVTY